MKKPFIKKINQVLNVIILLSLAFFALSYFKTDTLPGPKEIVKDLYEAPIQTPTEKAPFSQTYDDKEYTIEPLFEYDFHGLIVTSLDLKRKWFNIYYDSDPYNIKDICVIWGTNLLQDYYQKVSYKSDMWTCRYRFCNKDILYFNHNELSNNHLLPATEEVAEKLNKVRTGDQVHLTGYLVKYSIADRGGERTSSTTRFDKGKGACEVVYVEELKILKAANTGWRFINSFSLSLLILALILKTYIFLVY